LLSLRGAAAAVVLRPLRGTAAVPLLLVLALPVAALPLRVRRCVDWATRVGGAAGAVSAAAGGVSGVAAAVLSAAGVAAAGATASEGAAGVAGVGEGAGDGAAATMVGEVGAAVGAAVGAVVAAVAGAGAGAGV
jgi:hypothetical protein